MPHGISERSALLNLTGLLYIPRKRVWYVYGQGHNTVYHVDISYAKSVSDLMGTRGTSGTFISRTASSVARLPGPFSRSHHRQLLRGSYVLMVEA